MDDFVVLVPGVGSEFQISGARLDPGGGKRAWIRQFFGMDPTMSNSASEVVNVQTRWFVVVILVPLV